MAELAAGGLVIVGGAYGAGPQSALPKFGLCQSATSGPPPTDVIVDWADGTQTTYAAVNTGISAVLWQVAASQQPSLLGSVVQIANVPNPGKRAQGVVVEQFLALDPSGDPIGEIVIIHTAIGYVFAVYSTVSAVPAA